METLVQVLANGSIQTATWTWDLYLDLKQWGRVGLLQQLGQYGSQKGYQIWVYIFKNDIQFTL